MALSRRRTIRHMQKCPLDRGQLNNDRWTISVAIDFHGRTNERHVDLLNGRRAWRFSDYAHTCKMVVVRRKRQRKHFAFTHTGLVRTSRCTRCARRTMMHSRVLVDFDARFVPIVRERAETLRVATIVRVRFNVRQIGLTSIGTYIINISPTNNYTKFEWELHIHCNLIITRLFIARIRL